jgi:glycosyltransferase involved in cell wall biosynthesis
MSKQISIIMPFLNEGNWPYRTIQSIYDTADSNLFEIIAINENRKDNYDFSKYPEVKYIVNPERKGVDASRQLGAELSTTSKLLILDAHMLMYPNTNWLNKVIDCIEREPTTAWCFTCCGLGYGVNDINVPPKGKYYGADLRMYTEKEKNRPCRNIIEPIWRRVSHPAIEEKVQVILGANYAFSKDWYMRIGGLKGLKSWGSSEPFLSIKSHLSGGSCKVRTDVEIGHHFRDNAPYTTEISPLVFNKILMLKTIFPKEIEEKYMEYLPKDHNFKRAMEMIEKEKGDIEFYKNYYQSIFTRSIYDFCSEFDIAL